MLLVLFPFISPLPLALPFLEVKSLNFLKKKKKKKGRFTSFEREAALGFVLNTQKPASRSECSIAPLAL